LARAREQLRISLAAQERIAAALQQSRQTGAGDPEILAAYQSYNEHIAAIVAENRRLVARLAALQARSAAQPAPSPAGTDALLEPSAEPPPLVAGDLDPVTALDRELDASLAKFDAALLKEVDLIRQQSSETLQDLSADARAAARRLKEHGIDLEGDAPGGAAAEPGPSAGETGSPGSPGKPAEGSPGQSPGTSGQAGGEKAGQPAGEAGQQPASTGPVREGDGNGAGGPGEPARGQARYESGADDDIVARQLREAAEQETDPVLKEKLWQEYEAYKKNQQ